MAGDQPNQTARPYKTVGFNVYTHEYDTYKNMQASGRIKFGEMAKFMRYHFLKFLEAHMGNRVQDKANTENEVSVNTELQGNAVSAAHPMFINSIGQKQNEQVAGEEGV